jgi:hypothetical protein
VEVVVNRPDVRVSHRRGYYALKEFTKWTESERNRQLEEAMGVDRPFSEVPFILQADYFMSENGNSMVPVSVQLAGDGVVFENKGNRREAQFELLAQVMDPEGKVAGVARDTVRVRLPVPSAEKIQDGQILYHTGFRLRPGTYELKFLIRDNRTGKLGTFVQPLQVPAIEADTFETSSVVLGSRLVDPKESSDGVEHRGPARRFRRQMRRQDPLLIKGQKIIPSIGNVFLAQQTLYVYFEVYGAQKNDETNRPRLRTSLLLLRDNTKARSSEAHYVEEWTRGGVSAVAMAMPLRGLEKGAYTLQIHLRDDVAGSNLFRRVPLVIEELR